MNKHFLGNEVTFTYVEIHDFTLKYSPWRRFRQNIFFASYKKKIFYIIVACPLFSLFTDSFEFHCTTFYKNNKYEERDCFKFYDH